MEFGCHDQLCILGPPETISRINENIVCISYPCIHITYIILGYTWISAVCGLTNPQIIRILGNPMAILGLFEFRGNSHVIYVLMGLIQVGIPMNLTVYGNEACKIGMNKPCKDGKTMAVCPVFA